MFDATKPKTKTQPVFQNECVEMESTSMFKKKCKMLCWFECVTLNTREMINYGLAVFMTAIIFSFVTMMVRQAEQILC